MVGESFRFDSSWSFTSAAPIADRLRAGGEARRRSEETRCFDWGERGLSCWSGSCLTCDSSGDDVA